MLCQDKIYAINPGELQALFDVEAQLMAAGTQPPTTPVQSIKTEGKTAVISVTGMLVPKPNILSLFGFATPLTSIQNQLYEAVNDAGISRIIMCFDSPGGSITGINELANTIHSINKPCTAYVVGQCASAAFWLAAACDNTAILGSVGVVGTFQRNDNSKIEIVSSNAQDKRPDVETEHGRATLLKMIDDLEEVFISSLTTFRQELTKDKITNLKGGVLIGANAVNYGLANGIGSLSDIIKGIPMNQNPESITGSQESNHSDGWEAATHKLNAQAKSNQPNLDAPSKNIEVDNDGWGVAVSKINSQLKPHVQSGNGTGIADHDDSWSRAAQKINHVY